MELMIPDYVERRLRRQPSESSAVVPGSTPVVAFGNAAGARVATLGLNPSRQEFLDTHGKELDSRRRRFETLVSLGVPSLASASDDVISAVLECVQRVFPAKSIPGLV